MGWQEKIIGLTPDMFDDDWPNPTNPGFWQEVSFQPGREEAEIIIPDQVLKLFGRSQKVKIALASCYLLNKEGGNAFSDDKIQALLEVHDTSWLDRQNIMELMTGPSTTYILDILQVGERAGLEEPFHIMLKRDKNIKEKLSSLSNDMKALAFYGFLSYFVSLSYRVIPDSKILYQREAVTFIVEELGLNPPEII